MTDLDLTADGARLELTVEGEVADILDIFEKTDYTFTGVIRKDDGTIIDPAAFAVSFGIYDGDGGTLIKEFDTAVGGIVVATDKFTLTIDAGDIAISSDVTNGQWEMNAYSGGSLSGDVTQRVQGLALVREANKE